MSNYKVYLELFVCEERERSHPHVSLTRNKLKVECKELQEL